MPASDSRGRARRRPHGRATTVAADAAPVRRRRRARRSTRERPINTGLLRVSSLLLLLPLLLLLVSIGRPGPYPASTLPTTFDVRSATSLAAELSRYFPNRVPGSGGAAGAADWVEQKLALYGLEAQEDGWDESIPGLGRVRLRNLTTVVPGASPDVILVLAHRDNVGTGPGANDNASGTAALIELVRGYGRLGTIAGRPQPMHTLVFVSTDGGAYGGYGAARFAATSPLRHNLQAVVSLDGLAGSARPRLALAGTLPSSPTPALVRTADVRISEALRTAPAKPGWLTQLVDLAVPYGFGEQAPFLAHSVSAIRISTAPDGESGDALDTPGRLDRTTFARLGRAAAGIVASLDGGVELVGGTGGNVYLGDRVVRGWALELLLLTALVPVLAVTVDLFARCRRRRLPLPAAWRALRVRFGVWLWLALVVWLGALAGVFPRDLPVTPPAGSPAVSGWPVGWMLVLAGLAGFGWWRARRVLRPAAPASEDEALAGYAVALVVLAGTGIATALISPYGLLFVLPSLYAWLWLPQVDRGRGIARDVLFGVGFAGPLLALVAMGTQLGLGLDAPLYAVSLATLGFVPWTTVLVVVLWGACACQLGALAAGRYRPVPRRKVQTKN